MRKIVVTSSEADDLAQATFLSRSCAAYKSDTRMSFCNSSQRDGNDGHLADSYDYYYDQVDSSLFKQSFIMDGREFVDRALSVRNVILNVSSVLWDKQHLEDTLQTVGKDVMQYSLVGDWCLYLACMDHDDCSIAYIADSLNIHRRHESSVTHALDLQQHLDEILAMHTRALGIIDSSSVRMQQADYEIELRKQFDLPTTLAQAA